VELKISTGGGALLTGKVTVGLASYSSLIGNSQAKAAWPKTRTEDGRTNRPMSCYCSVLLACPHIFYKKNYMQGKAQR